MIEVLLTKTTAKGEVVVKFFSETEDCCTYLNGRLIGNEVPRKLPKPVMHPTAGKIEYVIGQVALTKPEFDQVQERLDVLFAPARAKGRLAAERNILKATIADIDERISLSIANGGIGVVSLQREREQAVEKLKNFDEFHPEILAAKKANDKAKRDEINSRTVD